MLLVDGSLNIAKSSLDKEYKLINIPEANPEVKLFLNTINATIPISKENNDS